MEYWHSCGSLSKTTTTSLFVLWFHPHTWLLFLKKVELKDVISVTKNASNGNDKESLLSGLFEETKPSSAVMVGDRLFDRLAAKGNGILSIGCVCGYTPNKAMLADVVIHNAEPLFSAI